MKPRLFLLLLSLTLTSCFSLADDVTPPPGYIAPTPVPTEVVNTFPASAPDVNRGDEIYAQECAPCHGPTGQGDGPQAAALSVKVPALGNSNFAFDKSPARWFNIVTQGNLQNSMPAFISLSDQQRWDVVAYALSLSATAEQVQSGKALYETHCTECHGADGRQSSAASLADQQRMAALSNRDLALLMQQGIAPAMPAANLSDVDATHLAAYVRTFTFATFGVAAEASAPTLQPAAATPESTPAESTASAAAPLQPRGIISGTITNASGGKIPAGLKVILHTFIHDLAAQQFTEGETRETTVSAQGTYRFDDLPLAPTDVYYVSVEYGGVTYQSATASPAQDESKEYNLPITIYETTTDTSSLAISTAHILLDYSSPGKIQVVEFLVLANTGNKAIVAVETGQPVIEIPLPQGYQNLQFEDGVLGGRFLQTADGFGDTLPIRPTGSQGESSIVFAFDMPYEADSSPLAGLFGGQKFELTQTFTLNVSALNLLVPQGVKAEGMNFTDSGEQSMGAGFTFHLYQLANGLEAGQTFTAKISGAPVANTAASSQSGDSKRNLIIGVGALGAVLILAGVFFYWHDRQAQPEEEDFDVEEEDEETLSEEDILDAIIALDDQFRAGNLTEEAYQERRAELKAKLRHL